MGSPQPNGTERPVFREPSQRVALGGYPSASMRRALQALSPRGHRPARVVSAPVPRPPASGGPAIPGLLRPDVALALTILLDEHLGVHAVEVLARGTTITLRGQVKEPLDRLLAEDLAFSFAEIERCCNLLSVADPTQPSAAPGDTER